MMIVMSPEATEDQIEAVRTRLESIGHLHVLVMPGELTTAIGAIGDPEGVAELGLEGMAGGGRGGALTPPDKLAPSAPGPRAPTDLRAPRRLRRGWPTFLPVP